MFLSCLAYSLQGRTNTTGQWQVLPLIGKIKATAFQHGAAPSQFSCTSWKQSPLTNLQLLHREQAGVDCLSVGEHVHK